MPAQGSARILSPQSPCPRTPLTHALPQSSRNPSWGPPRGPRIPPTQGPLLLNGRFLATTSVPKRPPFHVLHFQAPPGLLKTLSRSPPGQFREPLRALLGRSSVLRPTLGLSGCLSTSFRHTWTRKSTQAKSFVKHRKILTILAFSGFSLRLSWCSRTFLRALAAILDPADALCGRPVSLSGPSSAVWALSWRLFRLSGAPPFPFPSFTLLRRA